MSGRLLGAGSSRAELSIRSRVLGWTLALVAVLVPIASAVWYHHAERVLVSEFDRALKTRTETLAALLDLVDRNDEGDVRGPIRVKLELPEPLFREYRGGRSPAYYQLWQANGVVVQRSPTLGKLDLPREVGLLHVPKCRDLRLPDQRAGRSCAFTTVVLPDPEDVAEGLVAVEVQAVVAMGRENLDQALASLLLSVLLVAGGLALGALLLIAFAVHRGLAPLRALGQEVGALDPNRLPPSLDSRPVPTELGPIVTRLNELLARVRDAIERERRTTANIAHELKTPIAELRALTEVSLKWPNDQAYRQRALEEAQGIATQMQALVETLVGLARAESGRFELQLEQFDLGADLDELRASHQRRAVERGLTLELECRDRPLVETDRRAARIILTNLLSNAVEHSPAGSTVRCVVDAENGSVRVRIRNPGNGLRTEDLPRLGERFWRQDAARTQRDHAGLGLALTRELAKLLDARLAFALRDGELLSEVRFVARRPRASTPRRRVPRPRAG